MNQNSADRNDHDNPALSADNDLFGRIGTGLCFGGSILLILAGALAFILSSCRSVPHTEYHKPAPPSVQRVKVRLFHDLKHVSVATRSLCHWHAGNESDWADRSYREQHEISAIDNRLHVNGEPIGSDNLQIRPADKLFEVRDRQYRGELDISISSEGRLVLMEQLPLEDYIRSVVPSEMPARWPMNALKAQAVAARTFAAHRIQNKNGRRWMSRLDLAYKGVDGEYPRTNKAVEDTGGTILTWANKPLPAFFHSTCGGQTVSAESVFDNDDIPPLRGTTCQWCRNSPHYRWETTIKNKTLVEALHPRGIDQITGLTVAERDRFDRAESLLVNRNKLIPAAAFRMDVGHQLLKSTWFYISSTTGGFRFSGRGWGHGVGLCQYGARGMASEDRSWEDILHHYFPGAEFDTLD